MQQRFQEQNFGNGAIFRRGNGAVSVSRKSAYMSRLSGFAAGIRRKSELEDV
jgi:hypothetical protein